MKLQQALDLLNIPAQWQRTTGAGVKVALIGHPCLTDRMPNVHPVNYTAGHWHGTVEAWLVNQAAPDTELFSLQALNGGWSLDKCLDWCIDNGIHIVNMSMYCADTQANRDALQRALDAGIILVGSSGNFKKVTFPGRYPGVITVANLCKDGVIASDSGAGPEVELAAPGVIEGLPWPPWTVSGTSFGTPFATGMLALVKAACPWMTPAQADELVKKYARDLLTPGRDDKSGYGVFVLPAPEEWIIAKPKEVIEKLNIVEEQYEWNGALSNRTETKYIVLHHSATGNATAQQIHRSHVANGWAGISYHYYIRKDGTIYRGRPLEAIGAHCIDYNAMSVGICAEGNYTTETMPERQKEAIIELCRELLTIYPAALIMGHGELNATACPGDNYPLTEIKQAAVATEVVEPVDPYAITIKVGAKTVQGRLIDDVTWCPVRSIAAAMGWDVVWDGNTRTVTIK